MYVFFPFHDFRTALPPCEHAMRVDTAPIH
jgi:hypothetical protein